MNLPDLEKNLNLDFKNKALLRQALTHRSYLNEHAEEKLSSNERLEFLGDAVLEFVVSEILFTKFPKPPEGVLTALRAKLVCTESLAEMAKDLKLGEYLYLSRGEEKENGRKNQTLLANVFEALIGAIFQDRGIQTASEFIEKHFDPKISTLTANDLKDPKSLLQEKIQRREKMTPYYKVLKELGPHHARVFTVGVYLSENKLGEGYGHSKQEAEEEAARAALKKI